MSRTAHTSALRDTRILVTGGAGFVGSNLVVRLLDEGVGHLHVVDNLLSADRDNVPADARVRFTEGSIADDAVLQTFGDEYDYVFHLATYHGNQSSIHDPIADHDNNLLTTLKLFERLKSFTRPRRIVYAGAGCAVAEKTFDDPTPTDENAPISLRMDSPYSISKLVGEFYAVYYHERHQLPTVRARFQNVYGPREILGAGQWRGTPATVWRNVTPTFIYKALRGESLPLEGDGDTTRDFIYVDDLVEGLIACALRGAAGDVYNLASGHEISIRDLAMRINEAAGNPAPPTMLPRRTWDRSGRRFGDPAKARLQLGFEARIAHDEGIRRTVTWTRDAMPLIERCMQAHQAQMANC
ncbi:MAG: NAD-dependent epimerase/dehydratase family protein [Gemmatimonadaceae bacterium]|nr:NAD-dependent epimerase/dehydratase family protein [Gemmatimonadaceae bacterium]